MSFVNWYDMDLCLTVKLEQDKRNLRLKKLLTLVTCIISLISDVKSKVILPNYIILSNPHLELVFINIMLHNTPKQNLVPFCFLFHF
mmetsp:Transcript_20957/g.44417  ORF Transcript_20957/g.44417 Transcript_20957/m.44417 type:complete len:87 (+) Transcript_20957:451-711(+)